MCSITRSCLLLLWMFTLTLVRSQECTLEEFRKSRLFDSNFDISGLQETYPGGKQVRVNCNVGFAGFYKIICIEGKWESRGSRCAPKSCGHPGDAQFADFQLEKGDDFIFGSKVVYTCHNGYHMVSRRNYRICMADGWDGVVPVCEAQHCPMIDVDENVLVNGDIEEATFGNVVRFSCKTNEILEGPTELYCDDQGNWSGSPPKCIAIKCKVPQIENGHVTEPLSEYTENQILRYGCNQGYQRAELRESRCTKIGLRGDWSPTPACELIKCKFLLPPPYGTRYIPEYKNVFSPGESVRVICDERLWISNRLLWKADILCKDDGQWAEPHVCQEVVCIKQDTNVQSWSWTLSTPKMRESVGYRCKEGYMKKRGDRTQATCTRPGWEPDPLCEEVTCVPEEIQFTDILNRKSQYKYREEVTYVCRDGYVGRFSLRCESNGRFYGDQTCRPMKCDRPLDPNADLNRNPQSSYRYNDKVEFVCKAGGGGYTLTCRDNGWDGTPTCTDKKGSKPEVENGFVVGPLNNTVYYTCNDGYKLLSSGWWGAAKFNGRSWEGLHQCIEQADCPLPDIPHGKVSSQKPIYKMEDTIQILCNEKFQRVNNALTCNNGTWEPDPKQSCQPLATMCSTPPYVENAVVLKPYQKEYLDKSTVKYTCRDGFSLENTNGRITCKNGNWEEKTIKCVARPLSDAPAPTVSHKNVASESEN